MRWGKTEDQWRREHRWDRLAAYNAEVARGIVHTAKYDAEMAQEQEAWRREQMAITGARPPMRPIRP